MPMVISSLVYTDKATGKVRRIHEHPTFSKEGGCTKVDGSPCIVPYTVINKGGIEIGVFGIVNQDLEAVLTPEQRSYIYHDPDWYTTLRALLFAMKTAHPNVRLTILVTNGDSSGYAEEVLGAAQKVR